jgi:hypothetical protein
MVKRRSGQRRAGTDWFARWRLADLRWLRGLRKRGIAAAQTVGREVSHRAIPSNAIVEPF